MNLYYQINPLKPHLDFSNQTCNLLDMKYNSYGWTTLSMERYKNAIHPRKNTRYFVDLLKCKCISWARVLKKTSVHIVNYNVVSF